MRLVTDSRLQLVRTPGVSALAALVCSAHGAGASVPGCGDTVDNGAGGGRIVAAYCTNIFGTDAADADSARFAVNAACWLTHGRGERVLMLVPQADSVLVNYDDSVLMALENAGFVVTLTDDPAEASGWLDDHDAVFFGQSRDDDGQLVTAVPDTAALRSFLSRGGGVYVAAGSGPFAEMEAAALNPFLTEYGIRFAEVYNWLVWFDYEPSSGHPIFAGVGDLFAGNGNSIEESGDFAGASVLEFHKGEGLYAVVEGAECRVDIDRDGRAGLDDVYAFLWAWLLNDDQRSDGPDAVGVPPVPIDFNEDGVLDVLDVVAYLSAWQRGC